MSLPRVRMLALALAALTALSATPAAQARTRCPGADSAPTRSNLAQAGRATLCLLNAQRHQRGLGSLRSNRALARAAGAHSRDMVRRRYFDHVAPGGSDPVNRVLHAHYASTGQAWTIGENISWGSSGLTTPREAVRMWMHSAPHRANILRRSFREIGIGIALGTPSGSHGATYTTDFGVRS